MQPMSGFFSRTIRAAHIKEAVQTRALTALPGECAALAAAFGLPGIAALRGVFSLRHERAGIIAAQLHLVAAVTQICVITLEPFDTGIDEHASLRFIPAAALHEDIDTAPLDAESLDGPDEIPYAGDAIDLGAALAEQLALSLDPYPRKPGATLPAEFGAAPVHPFAGLTQGRVAKPD